MTSVNSGALLFNGRFPTLPDARFVSTGLDFLPRPGTDAIPPILSTL
ncbi:hypothetical protein V8P91_10640 [Acinetobacter baumannii]